MLIARIPLRACQCCSWNSQTIGVSKTGHCPFKTGHFGRKQASTHPRRYCLSLIVAELDGLLFCPFRRALGELQPVFG
jgi:hypothetical protein